MQHRLFSPVSRLTALRLGGSIIAGTTLATCGGGSSALSGGSDGAPLSGAAGTAGGTAPQNAGTRYTIQSLSNSAIALIQKIIDAQGTYDNGVLSIELDRDDIQDVHWRGIKVLPSFEINGDLVWQCLADDTVMMNADVALKASEVLPFIDGLIRNGVTFQAHHQHYYSMEPDIWFIHFRKRGETAEVAHAVKNALNGTSIPFPQAPPPHPTTPLPAEELGDIIGASPSIGANGVVGFNVPRANPILLGGEHINPYLNIQTNIFFQPLGGGNALVSPDIGMIASEVQSVVGYMRAHAWDSGCLYNQETDEQPQLFFDHFIKAGNALQLAHEIRGALDLTNVTFKTP